jgi:hypothetical protein
MISKLLIKTFNMKLITLLLAVSFIANSAISQVYTTASKVEILEGHTWYPGKIIEVKGDQYKIHYDMYSSIWDIWIKKDRLRVASASENNNQLKAISETSVSGTGKLYSGASANGGSVYYFMDPSGHIIMGCPTGGLENFNYKTYCTNNKSSCGVYNKSGNTITVTWNSGNTWKGKLNPNGDIELNSSLVGPVKMIPNKLSAKYEFTLNTKGISVAETIYFKDDGTYTVERVSGYDQNDGKNSAEWQSSLKGRYIINGYTITLTDKNSKISKYTVYALEATKNPEYLGWDGNFLTRGK